MIDIIRRYAGYGNSFNRLNNVVRFCQDGDMSGALCLSVLFQVGLCPGGYLLVRLCPGYKKSNIYIYIYSPLKCLSVTSRAAESSQLCIVSSNSSCGVAPVSHSFSKTRKCDTPHSEKRLRQSANWRDSIQELNELHVQLYLPTTKRSQCI